MRGVCTYVCVIVSSVFVLCCFYFVLFSFCFVLFLFFLYLCINVCGLLQTILQNDCICFISERFMVWFQCCRPEMMKILTVHTWGAAKEEKVYARAMQVQNVSFSILGHNVQQPRFTVWRIKYKAVGIIFYISSTCACNFIYCKSGPC